MSNTSIRKKQFMLFKINMNSDKPKNFQLFTYQKKCSQNKFQLPWWLFAHSNVNRVLQYQYYNIRPRSNNLEGLENNIKLRIENKIKIICSYLYSSHEVLYNHIQSKISAKQIGKCQKH